MQKTSSPGVGGFSELARLGINGRLMLLLLAVLAPLLIIQALTFYDRFQTEKANELQHNLEVARAVGNTFENFVMDVVHQELAIGLAATASPPLSRQDLTRLLEQSAKDYAAIRAFHWVGPDGRILLSSDSRAIDLDLSDRTYFKEIKAGREWLVGDLTVSKLTGEPVVVIGRGVSDRMGTFLGMVIATLDPPDLDSVLTLERQKEAGISLMDSQGRLVHRFPPVQLSWEERQWAEIYPIVQEALQGKEGTAILPTTSFDRKSRLMAVTPIRGIGWVAGAGKREETAMRAVTTSLVRHGSIFVLTAITACLLAWWICRTISRPMKKITGQLAAIGAGELQALTERRGPPEINEFAGAFNAMLARLRKNQARLETVFTAIPHALLEYDADLKPKRANAAALQTAGFTSLDFSRDQVVAKLKFRNLDGSRVRIEDLPTTRALRGESIAGELYAITSADGRERVISTYAAPLSSHGKIDGVVVLWHDITEQRQAEAALAAREHHFHSLFDNMLEGYAHCRMVFDERKNPVDFEYLEVNQAVERLTGLTEVAGKRATELFPGIKESYPELLEAYGRVARTGQPEKFEIEFKPLAIWLAISVYSTEKEYFTAVFDDITRRKQAEEELRQAHLGLEARVRERTAELAMANVALAAEIGERNRAEEELQKSKERLQLALRGADLGMWDWNIETGEVVFNRRWAEMLGYTLEEIEPNVRFWESLVNPEDRPDVLKVLKAHLQGKTPYYESEQRLRHKSGEWVWVLDKGKVTHRDEQGRPLRAVGTHLDITARKKAEAERLAIQQRLQQVQKSESLNRMAGAIAHNFNNMLAAVIGNQELALFDAPQGSEQHRFLNNAMQAAHRAAEISRFMLTYVGQTALKAETIDPATTAREAGTLMMVSLSPNMHIRIDLPPADVMVKADGVHVTQILTNLMTNAVEAFEDREGTINLTMDVVDGRMIREAKLFPPNWEPKAERYVCFTVADNGPGMDRETLDNIFDPFFSTKFVGRGMGLPVALGLLRAYNGAIAVESAPGQGATFKVFLPVALEEPLAVAAEEALAIVVDGTGRLILVVDDEPAICTTAADLLKRRFGFEVLTAGDGAEAVEIFGRQKDGFSMVILDLSMPGMNGWQTLAALRALRPDIPVILASGYDEAQVMSDTSQERPQAFLHKPYGLKQLQAALVKAQLGGAAEEEKAL